ncbi:hypothetical protein [uncultured Paraglaciecola sp.]
MPSTTFRWSRFCARKEEVQQALKYLNLPLYQYGQNHKTNEGRRSGNTA